MRVMEPTARSLVVEVVAEHADSLLRVARRYAGCATDAEDAYQRALEIFIRNAGRLERANAHKWLHTVVKHEALQVRRQRAKLVGVEEESALDALDDGRHLVTVEERGERFEEMTRAAEALKRLKPQEVTALVLKAQGLSYNEIAEREGWTYTKVNRCLTEGRRSFLERFAGIQSGAECDRWSPVLSAMADGEAAARDVMEVRPHLRNCPACRATLAEMRRAPAAAAAVVPVGVVGGGLLARLGELFAAAGATKVAAVGASAAAIAGGGVAVERSVSDPPARAAEPAPAAVVAPAAPGSERSAPASPVAPAASNDIAEGEPEPARREARPEGDEFGVEASAPPVPEPPAAVAPRAAPEPEPEPEPRGAAGEFGFEPGR